MGRYERRFDWEAARRMYEVGGETLADIARHFGVTASAVDRVVKEGGREQQAAYHREWQRTGVCPRCGGPMNRAAEGRGSVCRVCAGLARRSSVREELLRCGRCREWKPDSEFPRNKALPHRRGRHFSCTACGTLAKQEYRARHREKEREYQERYYREVRRPKNEGKES